MAEQREKSKEQKTRGKEHILLLRGEAEAISKYEIPRCTRNDKLQVLSNQKGIALIMVLVLSAIALVIMAGLIYMITSGTQISGMQKRYKTALEAGKGGSEVTYLFIAQMGDTEKNNFLISKLSTASIPSAITTPVACTGTDRYGRSFNGIAAKLNTQTSTWSVSCNSSFSIDPLTTTTYDMQFDLGTVPVYRVYSKIVDTVAGNSSPGEELDDPQFPPVKPSTPQHFPYLYTIEIDAENLSLPVGNRERAKLSILYQY